MSSAPNGEPRHPMRLVARRTGLTPARLRIWERRYGVVRPERSAGGQRLYSDDDIARLTLLARATAAGHALAQIARLSRDQLEDLLRDERSAPPVAVSAAQADPMLVERLMGFVERLDGAGLERALRRAALSRGPTGFAEQVAAPLLWAIGAAWHAGTISPAHEHLASGVVSRVITWLTGELEPAQSAPALAVATPAGERHELGAALAAAAAAEAGWRVIYLGADLPAADIVAAASQARVRAVALSIVDGSNPRAMTAEIDRVAAGLTHAVPLVVGGGAASALAAAVTAAGARVCHTLPELQAALREIASSS